jgi:hypothetical protein
METTDSKQKFKEYVEKESTRYATAKVYQLDNPYLIESEKIEVELWFQFPGNVLFVALCGTMIYSTFNQLSLKLVIGIPLLIELLVGVLNWRFYLKKTIKTCFFIFGNHIVQWGLTISTIAILTYHGHYWYSAIILAGKFGILIIISPCMWTYTFLSSKYKMHAKWVFFKRFYGYEFPFENEIEKPN